MQFGALHSGQLHEAKRSRPCKASHVFDNGPISIPASSAVKTTPKPTVDLRKHPTGGQTPIEVSVGLYITNLWR
jgi:hypothetical protein